METAAAIYFYGTKDEFGYMSNFYSTSFVDENNIKYSCSEQYLMYQKCLLFEPNNITLQNAILDTKSPAFIKSLGRSVKNFNQKMWDDNKSNIMIKGLMYKFQQNNDIKQKLINTNNKMLYEASKTDKIWGIGYSVQQIMYENININSYGSNLLGMSLMAVRKKLINLL